MPGLYRKKIEELEDTEEKLCWLLKEKPHLRDCDKCLVMQYWVVIDGWSGEFDTKEIHKLTPSETITRMRRHVQNDLGLWLPLEENTQVSRDISRDAVQEWAIKEKEMM